MKRLRDDDIYTQWPSRNGPMSAKCRICGALDIFDTHMINKHGLDISSNNTDWIWLQKQRVIR